MSSDEEITLAKVFDELKKLRTDFKHSLEATETRILLNNESIRSRVKYLEEENITLKNKLELVERNNRKNNIIVLGIEKQRILNGNLTCELNKLLNIQLQDSDISDFYYLGNSPTSPLKVELLSYQKKKLILQNSKNLKGTNIYIKQDLTQNQREDLKILRRHLEQVRQTTTETCYIRGERLIINNKPYTVEELATKKSTPAAEERSKSEVTQKLTEQTHILVNQNQNQNEKRSNNQQVNSVEEKEDTPKGITTRAGKTKFTGSQLSKQEVHEKVRHNVHTNK